MSSPHRAVAQVMPGVLVKVGGHPFGRTLGEHVASASMMMPREGPAAEGLV